jgi:transposase
MEDKRKIVLESLSPDTSIAAVARAHGINANLLHSWRWLYRRGELSKTEKTASFIPIKISPKTQPVPKTSEIRHENQEAHLEIILGDARVLVHGAVSPEVLSNVLKVLKC